MNNEQKDIFNSVLIF